MTVIDRIDSSAYIHDPKIADDYVDVQKLHPLYDKLSFRKNANLILVGPKGIGKSLSLSAWAAQNAHPMVTFSCSEDARKADLYGHYILRNDVTPFILGPITTAFEIANEKGSCVLCFEEINSLTPQCQKLLNSLCDFHRRIEVPTAQRVFELDSGAKLWVTGTMNTAVYGGVYSLNEDLKSRFNLLPLDYPSLNNEKDLLTKTLNAITQSVGAKIFGAVLRLANETRQGVFDYALSTRDVVQILSNIDAVGLKPAMWIASGKFEDKDRETFKERAKSHFGVQI